MARPRRDSPPDSFTSTEIAVAAGISARNLGLLRDSGLAPPAEGGGGRGSNWTGRTSAIQRAGLLNGVAGSGMSLLPAARLTNLVAEEFESSYGALLSNFGTFDRPPYNPNPTDYPWAHANVPVEISLRSRDDFWHHHLLRSHAENYAVGKALPGDTLLIIADRRYGYVSILGGPKTLSVSGDSFDALPSYRITGMARSDDAQVHNITDEVGNCDFNANPEGRERLVKIEAEFAAAYRNAVSLVQVNVSLAIRNAFDAVHDFRNATGAAFDWTATAEPPPGRYAGADAKGFPLDPNHAWNRDLPPDQRAARLREIEEHIEARDAKRGRK